MSIQNFTNTFLKHIKPGNQVLDLGAGEGNFTQMFLERGAIVTAVDVRPPVFQDARVITKKMKIEDFCATKVSGHYDLIFARNIIQFLDKDWVFETLFPWMAKHVTKQGIIAIETFYQDPEPPFAHPTRSLYVLKELNSYFMAWKEIYAKEYDYHGLDMNGQERQFFVSDLIIQKTHN